MSDDNRRLTVRGVKQVDFSSQNTKNRSRVACTRQAALGFILLLTFVFGIVSFVYLDSTGIPIPSWKVKPPKFVLPEREDSKSQDTTYQRSPLRGINTIKSHSWEKTGDSTEINETLITRLGIHQGSKCLNTVQGEWILTDSTGGSCKRSHMLSSGCCDIRHLIGYLSCNRCRQDLGCCDSFETCVSCCLSHQPAPLPSQTFSDSTFDDCMHICRISSRSIKHGNLYKRDFLKYCYLENLNIQNLNMSAGKIAISREGADCQQTCSDSKLSCIDDYLARLNDCDIVEKYLSCSKCISSRSEGAYPAAMNAKGKTQNHQDAGVCYINADQQKSDCNHKDKHLKRLCFCIP